MNRPGTRLPKIGIACLLALAASTASPARPARAALPDETPAQKDARMKWWREARFGMFIHWGLYSVPAGEWNGQKVRGYAEWIMNRARIPKAEYEKLQKRFNPTKYDAKAWVSLAKRAGMKYIVITSKHHDGFCLFNSEYTDYDMAGTPYQRDLLKPLADECRRQGLKICWYHSIMDWHHPKAKGDTFGEYVEHMKKQCRELLTHYGDIGVMWFDGEWIKEWSAEQGVELEKYLRAIQPNLIVNNRVGKRKRSPGDFGTPEQKIPATGMPGWDWETCMTINHTWGYSKHDENWKSTDDLIRKLIDVASKGGNFLLNVGPTAEGLIPQASVERLEGVGRWLDVNGEAVYGTRASVLKNTPWGRCTTRLGKLYLHVFQWPAGGRLQVDELKTPVKRAYLLADPKKQALDVKQGDAGTTIALPDKATDAVATVVVVETAGLAKPNAKPAASARRPAPIKDIKAYCLDFNWGGRRSFAKPGSWAGADPAAHVAWYKAVGANVIQTFCVSCNGYAWYKNGVVPAQPGLKHDFLPEVVKLGHTEGMTVMGYFCIGANTRWGKEHPDLSYAAPSTYHIPYTDEYLAYLSAAVGDAVKRTGIDGFMIDWVWQPRRQSTKGKWLDCEKKLYAQLMGEQFPGEDKLTKERDLAYSRKAIDRCWKTIHKAAKNANPNCIIWLTSNHINDPHVVNSDMYKQADWLMNEAGDMKRISAVKSMIGKHTRLITCLARWNNRDATQVVPQALQANVGLYGFTKPRSGAGLVPLEGILSRPVSELKGDDRNIAVLARAYHGASINAVWNKETGEFVEPAR